jgi:hypothetical protein
MARKTKMPKKRAASTEQMRVTLQVPGKRLSLRDTESLLSSIQGAIVWSTYVALPHPNSYNTDKPPLAATLKASFERFLSSESQPTLLYGAASIGGRSHNEGEPPDRFGGYTVERMTTDFVRTRTLPYNPSAVSGPLELRCRDLVDWSAEQFGREAIEVDSIRTTASIEVVLQLAPILAMCGLQNYAAAKEVIVYLCDVLRGWIGRVRPTGPAVPMLSKGMRDFFAQYDDVSLEAHSNGEWKIRLERGRSAPVARPKISGRTPMANNRLQRTDASRRR